MKDKSDKSKIILSVILVLGLMTAAYFIASYEPEVKMTPKEDYTSDSEIVSDDAKRTATMFVEANGTMGDVDKDINEETLASGKAISDNEARRLKSFQTVRDATIPGNNLIRKKTPGFIKQYTKDLNSPFLYTVSNITTSEPSEPSKLIVNSESGNQEYESVDVFVSFDSTLTNFTSAQDTSYDGLHTQMNNKERIENLKVTLVQSGELWFIYDIEDAERKVNERFSTWRGIGLSTVDYSTSVKVGSIKIPGIESYEEPLPSETPKEKPSNEIIEDPLNLDALDDPDDVDPRDLLQ